MSGDISNEGWDYQGDREELFERIEESDDFLEKETGKSLWDQLTDYLKDQDQDQQLPYQDILDKAEQEQGPEIPREGLAEVTPSAPSAPPPPPPQPGTPQQAMHRASKLPIPTKKEVEKLHGAEAPPPRAEVERTINRAEDQMDAIDPFDYGMLDGADEFAPPEMPFNNDLTGRFQEFNSKQIAYNERLLLILGQAIDLLNEHARRLDELEGALTKIG
jgi:hypothetical protein